MCVNLHGFVLVHMWHACLRVFFEMYLHCVCPSLVNVAMSCVGA